MDLPASLWTGYRRPACPSCWLTEQLVRESLDWNNQHLTGSAGTAAGGLARQRQDRSLVSSAVVVTRAHSDLVRDNQWWYSRHPLSDQLDQVVRIDLVVNGRRCPMTHSAVGRDGRVTRSFRFDRDADRDAWVGLRGQAVTIVVEHVGPRTDNRVERAPEPPPAPPPVTSVPADSVESSPSGPRVRSSGDAGRIFGAYLFCDWSAASRPKTGPDSIWFADGWFDENGLFVWGVLENPSTRQAAEKAIRDRLLLHRCKGRRTLVGFDFPLGYPAASLTGIVDKPKAGWRDLWRLLRENIRDDANNSNNRFEVAGLINARLREGWYWGTPTPTDTLSATKGRRGEATEFRVVEESLRTAGRRPFSVWQLFGNGSVGSQSLVGLPVCERLRADEGLGLTVWPFETGFAAPGRATTVSVMAEIWPGAIDMDASLHQVKDAAQVRSLVQWASCLDQAGQLEPWFEVKSLADKDRRRGAETEGWILGC